MRVTFSSTFRNGLLDVNDAAERLHTRTREVSSGKRIQVPSDDPSSMASAINEHSEMGVLDQYVRRNDSVEARLTIADSALSDIIKQITIAQGKGAAGRNTVLNPTQRQAIAGEIRGTRDAILRGINTSYNGIYLFSGGQSSTPAYAAGPPISAYQGDAQAMSLDVTRGRAVQATFNGQAILQGSAASDVFQTLTDLADAVENGNMSAIDTGLAELQQHFDRANTAQSRLGIDLASLADDRARTQELRRAADKRRSQLEDANLAESISGMQQADQAHRAALQALSTAGRLSLMDYLK
jgi:flagellar hook-associated protein 3 FlgL